MQKLFILIALLTTAVTGYAQELVLHKGGEKETITRGKVIGITLKGEEYKFYQWKNVYKTNNLIRQGLWEVDSISPDSSYLSGYDYSTSYTNTVIIRKDLKTVFKDKDYIIDSVIPSESGKDAYDSLYCRIIETTLNGQAYKAVNYNDIESLTFARRDMGAFEDENGNIDFSINLSVNARSTMYHHEGYHHSGSHIHVGHEKGAIIALFVILSVGVAIEVTSLIIDDIQNEVHTYNLKDWKIEVK